MTRTEDRLITALESTAAAVPVDAMRPLVAPGPGLRGQAGPRWHEVTGWSRKRRVWLAAFTAAAIAVIGAVPAALNRQPVARASYIGGSEPTVPAFFVDAGSTGLYDGTLRVVSLATAKVTATERAPAGDPTFLAEQAQTGNFIAAFQPRFGEQVLYRFRITGTGTITPLKRIRGITLKQRPGVLTALALSPDGSRLALSWVPDDFPTAAANARAELILLNLNTGARQVWNDNLADRPYYPEITSAVWTPGGHTLVFASYLCKVNAEVSACFWEFRRLRTPLVGDGLQPGPVLVRHNGAGGQYFGPAISSDGRSLLEIRRSTATGHPVTLVRISLDNGKRTVLHRWRGPGVFQVAGNEGNFLIVGQQIHPPNGNNWRLLGWVDDRGFHPLTYP